MWPSTAATTSRRRGRPGARPGYVAGVGRAAVQVSPLPAALADVPPLASEQPAAPGHQPRRPPPPQASRAVFVHQLHAGLANSRYWRHLTLAPRPCLRTSTRRGNPSQVLPWPPPSAAARVRSGRCGIARALRASRGPRARPGRNGRSQAALGRSAKYAVCHPAVKVALRLGPAGMTCPAAPPIAPLG